MKKRQFELMCRRLLPELPGFACKGWLLFATPVDGILRGFYCDQSGFDPARFSVTVFSLPLYVPTRYVHFAMGRGLEDEKGCEKWWTVNAPDLASDLLGRVKVQGLPFLAGTETP